VRNGNKTASMLFYYLRSFAVGKTPAKTFGFCLVTATSMSRLGFGFS
jgi:hypothetical protein